MRRHELPNIVEDVSRTFYTYHELKSEIDPKVLPGTRFFARVAR